MKGLGVHYKLSETKGLHSALPPRAVLSFVQGFSYFPRKIFNGRERMTINE